MLKINLAAAFWTDCRRWMTQAGKLISRRSHCYSNPAGWEQVQRPVAETQVTAPSLGWCAAGAGWRSNRKQSAARVSASLGLHQCELRNHGLLYIRCRPNRDRANRRVLVTGMCCAKTAEPIEMSFGADNCGAQDPTGRGKFGGCPADWEALKVSARVYAAKGIIQSSNRTSAIIVMCNCQPDGRRTFAGLTLAKLLMRFPQKIHYRPSWLTHGQRHCHHSIDRILISY